jgi:FkbH-like protein
VLPDPSVNCVLISDFSTDNFARLLAADATEPRLTVAAAKFGQVVPSLLSPDFERDISGDVAIVWTLPEVQVPAFGRLIDTGELARDEIDQQIDAFTAAIRHFSRRVRFVLVPSWVMPTAQRGLGILDLKNEAGIAGTLARMNLRCAEAVRDIPNVFPLNASRWIERAGATAFDPRLWYMAKVPFATPVFKASCEDVKAGLNGLLGRSKKLIILDLDDTLWGGIVGDVGWQNVRLGGHDAIGEALQDFQRALKSFKERGILLAIVSKNEEATALEAIRRHPEMVLRLEDFAGWRINWKDKAQNIVDLVTELNLGMDAAVFIDDNPVERGRVREALPSLLVPEWPANVLFSRSTLLGLGCFDAPSITVEDRQRTTNYVAERQRRELKDSFTDVNEWLTTLNVRVKLERLNGENLQRGCQLLNKTNQMNLSTRRLTPQELEAWSAQPNHALWTCHVSDRFGNSGLTGILSVEVEPRRARIVDFVLSCRVMGRRVEECMVWLACEHARKLGLQEVVADYVPTAKNKPCLDFWKSSGFAQADQNGTFTWDLAKAYAPPPAIFIEAE